MCWVIAIVSRLGGCSNSNAIRSVQNADSCPFWVPPLPAQIRLPDNFKTRSATGVKRWDNKGSSAPGHSSWPGYLCLVFLPSCLSPTGLCSCAPRGLLLQCFPFWEMTFQSAPHLLCRLSREMNTTLAYELNEKRFLDLLGLLIGEVKHLQNSPVLGLKYCANCMKVTKVSPIRTDSTGRQSWQSCPRSA